MIVKSKALSKEANAWIKRKNGPDEIIRVIPEPENEGFVSCYNLYTAFDMKSDYLGRVLFDARNYWIYDGEILTIVEQEQVARFIINYPEAI